eukprot:scpid37713/ scgid27855/ 
MIGQYGKLTVLFAVIGFLLLAGQGAVLNLYLASSESSIKSSRHWIWTVCDIGVLLFWFVPLVQHRNDDKRLKIWRAWLLYSTFLAIRVGLTYWYIAKDLDTEIKLGANLLKVTVASTAAVFMCFGRGSVAHEPNTVVQLYVERLERWVFLDILDGTEFLDVLFTETRRGADCMENHIDDSLRVGIIVVGVLALVLPFIALIEVEIRDPGDSNFWREIKSNRTRNGQLWYICLGLLINLAFLALRITLWAKHNHEISILMAKNVMFIIANIFDIVDIVF